MSVKRKARLNNLQLSYQRNDLVYEAVMIDLCQIGLIPKELVEELIGREISPLVKLPEGLQEDGQGNSSGSNSAS